MIEYSDNYYINSDRTNGNNYVISFTFAKVSALIVAGIEQTENWKQIIKYTFQKVIEEICISYVIPHMCRRQCTVTIGLG